MVAFIKEWVLNIVTLVLLIILIEMLLPSGRIKKYADLVTGFILIIAIINPFIGLIGGKFSLADSMAASGGFLDRAEIKKDSDLLEETQMKQIVEVYRKKIIARLEQTAMDTAGVAGARADVIINEDYDSENFGEIKRAYLEIEAGGDKDSVKPVSRIEKIRVGEAGQTAQTAGTLAPAVVKQLEDRIASLYGVDKSNIVISGMKE